MCTREHIKQKYQNSCHLKTISQNKQKSYQYTLGINMNIHMKYEILSLSMWAGEQIKEKYHKICHLKTTSQNDKIFNVHILGYICIFISNMKFLSLILWLGGLCTDADDDSDANNDADNTDNYARWRNHDYTGSFGRIPNEPKT